MGAQTLGKRQTCRETWWKNSTYVGSKLEKVSGNASVTAAHFLPWKNLKVLDLPC